MTTEHVYDEIRSRDDILRVYEVDARGVIRSPGMFEGEMLYVPYYWDRVLEGWQDWEEDDGAAGFMVSAEERVLFPELGVKSRVILAQRDDGFVVELKPD